MNVNIYIMKMNTIHIIHIIDIYVLKKIIVNLNLKHINMSIKINNVMILIIVIIMNLSITNNNQVVLILEVVPKQRIVKE